MRQRSGRPPDEGSFFPQVCIRSIPRGQFQRPHRIAAKRLYWSAAATPTAAAFRSPTPTGKEPRHGGPTPVHAPCFVDRYFLWAEGSSNLSDHDQRGNPLVVSKRIKYIRQVGTIVGDLAKDRASKQASDCTTRTVPAIALCILLD